MDANESFIRLRKPWTPALPSSIRNSNSSPEMSVAENLYLGHLPSRLGVVDRQRLHEAAHRDLERLGEDH